MRIAVEGSLAALTSDQRRMLLERQPADTREAAAATAAIIERVRDQGDDALRALARELDDVELQELEVPKEIWDEALTSIPRTVRSALERAAANIETFHRAQLPGELRMEVEPGLTLGRRFLPLPAVGVYAPGGRAAYPSSVLMGAVPARAAGVEEIVVCSPPGPDGRPSAVVMAAAALSGATRLFSLGGAGAVAAMAFGTRSVPRCAAVVGPGNRWVLEAKRQVAGQVLIDSPAGPSEVLVVADDSADAELVAAELVAQAEHDPHACVALVTPSADLLASVRTALAAQLDQAPRRAVVAEALAGSGALLLAEDLDQALAFADDYAAEHLALYTREPRIHLGAVRTAGTVFLGQPSAVAFGDYLTGANHVLPTAGTSRSFSGLSVLDFMRSYTWQELTPTAAAALVDGVVALAGAEGLPAHAAAARLRRPPLESSGGES